MMKRFSILFLLPFLLMVSCHDERKSAARVDVKVFEFSDSTKYCVAKVKVALPVGDDEVSESVRLSLLEVYRSQLNLLTLNQDAETVAKRAVSDVASAEAPVTDYGRTFFSAVEKNAMEMIEEQLAYQRRMGGEASGEFLPWCFEVVIDERKENSAENYIVFSNYNYSDMGGAHGSMSGEGAMTFDARSGRRFRNFLKDKSDAALRELILDGLVSCFSQEEKGVSRSSVSDLLLVGKEELSAPTQDPLPTDSGLLFQYQAYEIAPYAAGMPAFVLSYDKIRPFLTDEAATLLGVR